MNTEALELLVKSWEVREQEARDHLLLFENGVFGPKVASTWAAAETYKCCIADLRAVLKADRSRL